MREAFTLFTRKVEHAAGSPWAFILSVLSVVIWAAFGPVFNYSDTWQLIINTSTTVVTFWLVFIIQATQTRDTEAIHIKLNELIRVTNARNELVAIEDRPKEELDHRRDELRDMSNQ